MSGFEEPGPDIGWAAFHAALNSASVCTGLPSAASALFRRCISARAANSSWVSFATAGLTKALPKATWTTPPFAATFFASPSLMLRSKPGVKCRNAECEAITGTRLSRIASSVAASERWETSTMMPRRFISATTSLPNGLRPFQCFSTG